MMSNRWQAQNTKHALSTAKYIQIESVSSFAGDEMTRRGTHTKQRYAFVSINEKWYSIAVAEDHKATIRL